MDVEILIITKEFIKRRYAESRIGSVAVNPVLAASNFIMLIWITISTDLIPFWLFVPLLLITMITLVTIVGFKFRVIQLRTEEDIKYERQSDLNKTLYQIMLGIDNGNMGRDFYNRMSYVKRIAELN